MSDALGLAYRYINRRERTVAEVREHLIKHEIDPDEAEAVVRELVEQQAVDDERFARLFVQDKRQLERWGAERIRRGLQARGIERELAEAALAAADDEGRDHAETDTELGRALALLESRFAQPPLDRRGRDRQLGVLLRKGYEYELALEAIAVRSGSAA